jgi:hypothetical protein
MENQPCYVSPSPGSTGYISINRDRQNTQLKSKPEITLQGNGSGALDTVTLQNRAKKKLITQTLIKNLVDMAIYKGDLDMVKPYWRTYHCQSRVISSGGRLYGKYCKNRFCNVCSGIRKADIINRYLPEIKTWEDPHFVTLTAKAVSIKTLGKRVAKMIQAFGIIKDRYKKRDQRGTGQRLIGVRSLESNYNPVTHTYNPHFHVIVATRQMAEMLIMDWLELFTKKFTSPYAQNMRKVEDTERDLIEIVKYGTKIFTDPTMAKKLKVTPFIYVSAYHNIICAMKDHRIFDRFGFNLPKTTKVKGGKATKVTDWAELIFDPKENDWIDPETEQLLSGYVPDPKLMEILKGYIDKDLQ